MHAPALYLSWNALQLQGRRERQEDAWCVRHLPGGGALLALIADGLGGHPEGDYASRTTVGRVAEALAAAAEPVFRDGDAEARATTMRRVFVEAHRELLAYGASRGHPRHGPATTLIAAHLDDSGLCTVAGVGDSLVWRHDGERLEPLLAPQGEGSWVEFSIGSGIDDGRAVQISELQLSAGNRLVLATDGIDTVSASELQAILESPLDLVVAKLATAIHDAARMLQDNVTVVLIELSADRT